MIGEHHAGQTVGKLFALATAKAQSTWQEKRTASWGVTPRGVLILK